VIPNYSLDQALSAVIELVVEKASEAMRAQGRRPASETATELEETRR
jgi:hypothetical protein